MISTKIQWILVNQDPEYSIESNKKTIIPRVHFISIARHHLITQVLTVFVIFAKNKPDLIWFQQKFSGYRLIKILSIQSKAIRKQSFKDYTLFLLQDIIWLRKFEQSEFFMPWINLIWFDFNKNPVDTGKSRSWVFNRK